MLKLNRTHATLVLMTVVILITGCGPTDSRLVALSEKSVDRQVEQNRLVAKNNEQMSEATTKLVEAHAQSFHENSELQRQIQAGETELRVQRDLLEEERKIIAAIRHRDHVVAESIRTGTALIIAALPLALALVLVCTIVPKAAEAEALDVFIAEFVANDGMFQNSALPSSDVQQRLARINDQRSQGTADPPRAEEASML